MLDMMFDNVLAESEVKAIARSRGFPVGKDVSRAVVKNFFLTSLGVEQMIHSLSQQELAVLHLLAIQEEPVDITFFERLYHEANFNLLNISYLTFNQRFHYTLKEVRERLVRKGLIYFFQEILAPGSKIELWRFAFPVEFKPYLPPLLSPVSLEKSSGPEDISQERVQNKILQLTGLAQKDPLAKDSTMQFRLENGSLTWGKQIYTGVHLADWQLNCWVKTTSVKINIDYVPAHPVHAIFELIHRFHPDEWFNAGQLAPILEVQCFGADYPPVDGMLDEGWKWGLFARRNVEGKLHYSPRLPFAQADNKPILPISLDETIHVDGKRGWVDLNSVPALYLNDLNQMGRLALEKDHLFFSVDLARLSHIYPYLENSSLFTWIRQHIPAYETAYQTIQQHWGKTILHSGCQVAHITSTTLRMQIERHFQPGADYVSLGGDWLALRAGILPEVEKMVKKADYVVKRVTA